VERILSVSAVGSLKQEVKPTDFVIPTSSMIAPAEGSPPSSEKASWPTSPSAIPSAPNSPPSSPRPAQPQGGHLERRHLRLHGRPPVLHQGGEQRLPLDGFDVIGMTNLQEAKLAREAEICYVTIACTDYDCWHPEHDSVTVEQILKVLSGNAENAATVVREAVAALPASRGCKCGEALAMAIATAPEAIPPATRARLTCWSANISAKAGA